MKEVEEEVKTALETIVKEDQANLTTYIVGSILDGWESATTSQPYDIDVVIEKSITVQQGDLENGGRCLYLHELTINNTDFALHLHNHELDTNRKYREV